MIWKLMDSIILVLNGDKGDLSLVALKKKFTPAYKKDHADWLSLLLRDYSPYHIGMGFVYKDFFSHLIIALS